MSFEARKVALKEVAAWNKKVKLGDTVEYRSYPTAEPVVTTTLTAAEVICGHTSVVWLDGITGCVSTDACKPI